jgi:hypothetical protein
MQATVITQSVSGGDQNALALQGDVVLLPKLSSTQRNALSLTFREAGAFVYDTTVDTLYYWDGAAWQASGSGIPSGGLTGMSLVKLSDTSYDVGWAFSAGSGITKQQASAISLIFG